MDRELFIQQLVAALQENTALAGGVPSLSPPSPPSGTSAEADSSSDSAAEDEKSPQEYTGLFLSGAFSTSTADSERLARDAYMQLQFDFPQVQDASIEALAELYRRVAAEKSTQQEAAEIPVTATLLDGVAFLNNQGPSSGAAGAPRSRSSEASGLLAASLLLVVFRECLESPEDARVETLLPSLAVRSLQLDTPKEQGLTGAEEKEVQEQKVGEDDFFVVKYAAEEDPDDLSEVYEGHLPEPRPHRIPTWNQQTAAISKASTVDKLRLMATHTFSSSFQSVSMEKWEQWRLDEELVAIMKLLVDRPPEDDEQRKGSKQDSEPTTLYGPRGEWSRYLYVLRDRVLRFPGSSRNALWRLKELVEFLQKHQTAPTVMKHPQRRVQQPQHLVYRVLAELAISREFHQGAAQRAQQGLALAIQELLPLIAQEIHKLASVPSATSRLKKITTSEKDSERADGDDDDDGDDELAVVFLQLLHFMLFASPNARTTTEKLHESGMLRTLLSLLPPTPAITTDSEQQSEYLQKRWFPALLRLLGECALWHAGFAAYIVRVPKFVALLPMLREQLVAEVLLLALAFHQHEVQVRASVTSTTAKVNIWEVFTSESLFPQQCESYLYAMKKLQDAVFILDCLEKVLPALRPAMQKELQHSLQQIYSGFARSFEYPTFAAAEAARQQQQFEQQALDSEAKDDADDEKKEKKQEDRGQAEALQFTALRNKLRQSVKSLLAALSSGSAMAHVGGRASSKLD
ncbi:hypothetical protein PHYSODRAFT_556168 [Phytophthora sojae]|uniref:Uncharacterized protein n=1 Tax=Phytophthora sojae (strain P6497) TaxID=1094619 RepID=G4YRH5_PHYSP|nr:hypothetical protein PHYSODRAFT_556168 [Phytophthora sojae]EGZ23440.1 hypothetical protein PHYSODRAFT_556168 [Phytophthora sojae]|eukprot:XP_009518728.1 hypothetical protein PHYSODRAFT_556168 [Phytophthora sojae]